MAFTVSARQPWRIQRGCARTEKSCGPGARGSGVKSCGDCCGRPARASLSRKATGAIVQRSPRRARRTPLKPFAQGRPGDPARPVIHPVCIFWRTDLRVPAGGRPSLRPCLCEGRDKKQSSGESRREIANSRPLFETCNGAKRAGCRGAVSARAPAKSASRAWHLYLLGQ